jgi:hypothetical protein
MTNIEGDILLVLGNNNTILPEGVAYTEFIKYIWVAARYINYHDTLATQVPRRRGKLLIRKLQRTAR